MEVHRQYNRGTVAARALADHVRGPRLPGRGPRRPPAPVRCSSCRLRSRPGSVSSASTGRSSTAPTARASAWPPCSPTRRSPRPPPTVSAPMSSATACRICTDALPTRRHRPRQAARAGHDEVGGRLRPLPAPTSRRATGVGSVSRCVRGQPPGRRRASPTTWGRKLERRRSDGAADRALQRADDHLAVGGAPSTGRCSAQVRSSRGSVSKNNTSAAAPGAKEWSAPK